MCSVPATHKITSSLDDYASLPHAVPSTANHGDCSLSLRVPRCAKSVPAGLARRGARGGWGTSFEYATVGGARAPTLLLCSFIGRHLHHWNPHKSAATMRNRKLPVFAVARGEPPLHYGLYGVPHVALLFRASRRYCATLPVRQSAAVKQTQGGGYKFRAAYRERGFEP